MGKDITLSQEEQQACVQAFRTFDKDGSGTINSQELKAVIREQIFPNQTKS